MKNPHSLLFFLELFGNLRIPMSLWCIAVEVIELEQIVMGNAKGEFGLLIRNKDEPNKYVLIDFDDMDLLFEHWSMFKKEHLK